MTHRQGLWERARVVGRRHRLWLLPFGVAVLFGCLGSIDATEEFVAARGWPVERAVVVSVESDGSGWGCGKFDDHAVIAWRALRPSGTSDDSFTDLASCDDVTVGEVHEVVRVREGDEWVVYVDPPRSKKDVARDGATLAAVGFLGTWLLRGARVVLAGAVGRLLPAGDGRHRAGPWGG